MQNEWYQTIIYSVAIHALFYVILKAAGLAACAAACALAWLATGSLSSAFATGAAAACCEAGNTSNGTKSFRGLVKIY